MRTFKFFWETHKWTGIVLSAFLLVTSTTGLLLLLKKEFDWIQPPSQEASAGKPADFLPFDAVLEQVLAQGHPAFQSLADIDRVDFRPHKRLHKVRSVHDYMEMQVDAVNGDILSVESRLSDFLEDLHDGSWFAAGVHDYLMPVVACGVAFLVMSGLFLWLEPVWRRWRRRTVRSPR